MCGRAARRWQASVVELYDDSGRDLSPLRLLLGGSNDTLSSYRPLQLQVPRLPACCACSAEHAACCRRSLPRICLPMPASRRACNAAAWALFLPRTSAWQECRHAELLRLCLPRTAEHASVGFAEIPPGTLANMQSCLRDGAPVLQALRQDFFLPFGVKALAATSTSHGITSKIILMGTLTDQVGGALAPGPGHAPTKPLINLA
jgi:hypothetical protein